MYICKCTRVYLYMYVAIQHIYILHNKYYVHINIIFFHVGICICTCEYLPQLHCVYIYRHMYTYWLVGWLQHFFLILAGLLNCGSLRAQSLCLELVLTLLASCIQLTQAVCALVILLFNAHLLPLFYGIWTFVGYLMPNPFSYMDTQFTC